MPNCHKLKLQAAGATRGDKLLTMPSLVSQRRAGCFGITEPLQLFLSTVLVYGKQCHDEMGSLSTT